ncbi:MAG: hypothetical protein NT157_03415 [Candidatus Micrarchaeota archaeon]|nr:hypothetical protein [Candidatus Micrarchaeota archaeon]
MVLTLPMLDLYPSSLAQGPYILLLFYTVPFFAPIVSIIGVVYSFWSYFKFKNYDKGETKWLAYCGVLFLFGIASAWIIPRIAIPSIGFINIFIAPLVDIAIVAIFIYYRNNFLRGKALPETRKSVYNSLKILAVLAIIRIFLSLLLLGLFIIIALTNQQFSHYG